MSPLRTVPGPTSMKVSTPRAAIRRTDSVQRTRPVSWRASSSRSSSALVTGSAVALATTGMDGSRSGAAARCGWNVSTAGAISGEWKAPPTFSGTTRLAPSSLAAAGSRSSAVHSPDTTTLPGALSLATASTWPWAVASTAISTPFGRQPQDRAHRPGPRVGGPLHRLGPPGHQQQPGLERQRTGRDQGGELPEGVPGHIRRPRRPRPPPAPAAPPPRRRRSPAGRCRSAAARRGWPSATSRPGPSRDRRWPTGRARPPRSSNSAKSRPIPGAWLP